jgi:hypothetical protein
LANTPVWSARHDIVGLLFRAADVVVDVTEWFARCSRYHVSR